MKNTFRYIAAFAALVSGFAVYAQNLDDGTYKEENGIAYAKRALINEDGTYTIDLETFVTGAVTQTYEVHPADIVLVLDVSGSMADEISTVSSYEPATVNGLYGSDYNNYYPTEYYYQYNNDYYPLYIGRGGSYGRRRYYLFFRVEGRTYYINTSGQVVTNEPTDVSNQSTNLLASNVQLYTQETTTTTKMDALQSAVKSFIDQIAHNDLYEDDTDAKPRKDAQGNPAPLGNRIAIVKFGLGTYNGSTTFNANTHLTPGNHFCSVQQNWSGEITGYSNYTTTYNGNYNVSEVLAGFTPTATSSNVNNLKTTVEGLHAAGATAADMGMKLAYELVNRIGDDRSDSRKTIVFFTDGEPNHQTGYDTSVASGAISNSTNIKDISYTVPDPEHEGQTMTIHPTVFSVGLFSDEVDDRVDGFMTSIASSSDNYMDASGGTAEDLKRIFDAIAHSAGGSGNTDVSGSSTLTVDVVSSSFSVPKGFENNPSAAIEVLVAPCNSIRDIDGKDYLQFGEAKSPTEYGLEPITPNISEKDNKVTTTGFDYSANWCGPDPTSTSAIHNYAYHGFKQIIRFTITVKDDAVGGPGVETNDPNSGIYLPNATEPLVKFNRPTVKIPVQIWIQKQGLSGDESAVFNLRRIAYRGTYETDDNGDYVLDTNGNPIRIDYSKIPKRDWETFTKVVVNNQDMDDNGMVKVVGLDPDYVYRLDEDAWAFGYTYQDGGIQYTIGDNIENPFIFINIPENKKFDEASARNIFNEKTTQ